MYKYIWNGKKMKLVRISCKFALQFYPVQNKLTLWIQ